MTIKRDVNFQTVNSGRLLELRFVGDNPNATLLVRHDDKYITLGTDGIDALKELLAAGEDHQNQLRYEREAAERKAEREAKTAAADYSGNDEA